MITITTIIFFFVIIIFIGIYFKKQKEFFINNKSYTVLSSTPGRVATLEGIPLQSIRTDIEGCKQSCSNNKECNSFAYCRDDYQQGGNGCYLKSKVILPGEATRYVGRKCQTFYTHKDPVESGDYMKYPNLLSLGTTEKSTNIPNADGNGCLNNISLDSAKSICKKSEDCNSFFIYNDKILSRTCFKSKYQKNGTHTPSSSTLSDSAFYTLDKYKDLEEKDAIMNDKCLESNYLKPHFKTCCSDDKKLIGARRPMCEALPVWMNKIRVLENNYMNLNNQFTDYRNTHHSIDFSERLKKVGRSIERGADTAVNEAASLARYANTGETDTERETEREKEEREEREEREGTELVDKNESCRSWALNGECNTNPGYMLPNCAKSCHNAKLSSSSPPAPIKA